MKQSAIIAIAQLILIAHKQISLEIDMIMQILGERLSNELTREAALKAITLLASKQQKIKLENLSNLTPRLVALLHQAQRQIHLSTLETLFALLSRYGEQFVS